MAITILYQNNVTGAAHDVTTLITAAKWTTKRSGSPASLTVTDGSNVPNTGDSVSVIGFVMVGLALLATAAVVVKKVRA